MREIKRWTWHIISAIVIFIFLSLHMIVMHLDDILGFFKVGGEEAISWSSVLYRGKLLLFTITYIILLGAALYHGLYGLRNIIFELSLKEKTENIMNIIFLSVGIIFFILGSYAVILTYLNKF